MWIAHLELGFVRNRWLAIFCGYGDLENTKVILGHGMSGCIPLVYSLVNG
jgi:hypothetical protein